MKPDFILIRQKWITIFKAESGGAKIWARDNWQDNMKMTTPIAEEELIRELETLGFTVGSKAE